MVDVSVMKKVEADKINNLPDIQGRQISKMKFYNKMSN